MYKIVCLLDMLEYLKYIHIYSYMKSFFSLLFVGSVHFDTVFGFLSHGLN